LTIWPRIYTDTVDSIQVELTREALTIFALFATILSALRRRSSKKENYKPVIDNCSATCKQHSGLFKSATGTAYKVKDDPAKAVCVCFSSGKVIKLKPGNAAAYGWDKASQSFAGGLTKRTPEKIEYYIKTQYIPLQ